MANANGKHQRTKDLPEQTHGKHRKKKDLPQQAQTCLDVFYKTLLSANELFQLVEAIHKAIR
jgi:hypothetical protein